MSEFTWMSSVADIEQATAMSDAANVGNRLVALWPLQDHVRIDNDVKYAEDLQVRVTRQIAQVLCGQKVTMPDAEYVYEGADEIPGRPQEIVEALLSANDAYDAAASYSVDADIAHLLRAADALEVDESIVQTAIAPVINEINAHDEELTTQPFDTRAAWVVAAAAQIIAQASAQAMQDADTADNAHDHNAMIELLTINEIAERIGVPSIFVKAEQWQSLREAALSNDTEKFTSVFAPIAAKEWDKHYVDVTWDPELAKKKAKEEDERKSREALAAKFAHIQDDPNKPEVEL